MADEMQRFTHIVNNIPEMRDRDEERFTSIDHSPKIRDRKGDDDDDEMDRDEL